MYKYGANGFPFVKIGEEVVVGYNPEKYSKIMELESWLFKLLFVYFELYNLILGFLKL